MDKDKNKKQNRTGFTKIYNAFLDSEKLTYFDKMVFIAIKSFADNKTHKAYPSLPTISRISGVSVSQVRRCIEHLKKLGVLKVERRDNYKNNGRMSNLYTLYDSPDMWNDEPISEDDDFKAVAEELPDRVLQEEYQRRFGKQKESEFATPTKVEQNQTLEKFPISEDDYSKNSDICQYNEQFILVHYSLNIIKADNPSMNRDVDAVADILLDVLNSTKPTIRVDGQDRPAEVVKGKLLKLTKDDIVYSIRKFNELTERVRSPRAYMLTILYHAPEQSHLDVSNQVQHDMNNWEPEE